MNIPIRTVGIATTFFWAILIGFSVSAVYSFKDVRFSFGALQVGMIEGDKVVFSLPITIVNNGYYTIGSFNVTTRISDENGFLITDGSTFVPVIGKGREFDAAHNVTIDVRDLLQNAQKYVFNDAKLKVGVMVGMKIAEMIPVQASADLSVIWGGPLYNLTVGRIEYRAYNQTHLRANVPVSFENHALFDLTGNATVRTYNDAGELVSEGQVAINAQQHSSFRRSIEFLVPIAEKTGLGHIEVFFETPVFNLGPLVIPYG